MEEDRMSQLPDDILLLILDKIDIYEAFQTTFVSKRWKNLWCLLPSLRFRLSYSSLSLSPELVLQLLSHRDAAAAVHDFHLSVDTLYDDPEIVEECVLYAINHGVQSLHLHWPTDRELRPPSAFLTCETLRELELRNLRTPVKLPGRLSLPNLKTFHLETLLIFDDDEGDNMEPFSGLPELEKLTLIGYWYSVDAFVIKAPKLRVLEITGVSRVKEIYTPLLTSFRYESYFAWKCANVNLPMLEQVYLDIHISDYCFNFEHGNFIRMFHQFGNATTVSLTLDTLKVLERSGGPFEQTSSPFPNMKCLKVMEGHNGILAVYQGVMDYLARPLYCEVELSPSTVVVEDKDEYEKMTADSEVELYSDYSDDNKDIGEYSDEDEDIEFT